jgi:alpha-glucosidase
MPWQSSAANAGFSAAPPWLPVSPEHVALAVDLQSPDPLSQLALTRRLIGLRRGNAALREGSLHFIDSPPDLLVFERRVAEDRLLCAFNLGLRAGAWRPGTGRAWRMIESVGGARAQGGAHAEGGELQQTGDEEWRFPPLSGLIARCPP